MRLRALPPQGAVSCSARGGRTVAACGCVCRGGYFGVQRTRSNEVVASQVDPQAVVRPHTFRAQVFPPCDAETEQS
jgi:hypothetical protein